MKTNYLMLRELLEVYHPQQRGIASGSEVRMIKEILHLEEMDVLALRNLRDFTVAYLGQEDGSAEDWDRMSAITYVIDCQIRDLGGEV